MSLIENRESWLNILGQAFNSFFNGSLKYSGGKGKTAVVNMYSAFYDKWLVSEISSLLPVTPLGLISEISQRCGEGESFGFPYVKPDNFYRFKEFKVDVKTFSAETHPAAEDLKTFLQVVSKADKNIKCETGEIVLEKDTEKLLKNKLNLYSPGYLEFLCCLGDELGLIDSIPAINNSYVFRAVSGYEEFFETESIFDKIFEASLRVCCNGMNKLFPEELPFFSPDFIKKLLSAPVKTKDILGLISDDFVLEPEEDDEEYNEDDDYYIEDYEDDDFNTGDEEEMRMTSMYVLSISLSKWFYTVFGSYLHIIRPYSSVKVEASYLMKFYGANKNDIDYYQRDAFFTLMCEGYNLTAFGLKLFPGAKNPFSVENELLSKLSIRDCFEEMDCVYGIKNSFIEDKIESETNTFVVRIHDDIRKTRTDKYLELSEFNLLIDLCINIAGHYDIKGFDDFSLYTSENRSPFSEYTGLNRGGRTHKKAETTFVNEVLSDVGDKLWIELRRAVNENNIRGFCFTVEVLEKRKKIIGQVYPILRRKIK